LEKLNHVYVYIDGASRGNPGEAGIGIVIKDPSGNKIKEHKEYVGKRTNNEAEYLALIKGLHLALSYCKKRVIIVSDSELIVKQRNGQYKTKKKHLKGLASKVGKLQSMFGKVDYKHVERELNKDADRLANEAIEELSLK